MNTASGCLAEYRERAAHHEREVFDILKLESEGYIADDIDELRVYGCCVRRFGDIQANR